MGAPAAPASSALLAAPAPAEPAAPPADASWPPRRRPPAPASPPTPPESGAEPLAPSVHASPSRGPTKKAETNTPSACRTQLGRVGEIEVTVTTSAVRAYIFRAANVSVARPARSLELAVQSLQLAPPVCPRGPGSPTLSALREAGAGDRRCRGSAARPPWVVPCESATFVMAGTRFESVDAVDEARRRSNRGQG